eukprot:IDg20143t1
MSGIFDRLRSECQHNSCLASSVSICSCSIDAYLSLTDSNSLKLGSCTKAKHFCFSQQRTISDTDTLTHVEWCNGDSHKLKSMIEKCDHAPDSKATYIFSISTQLTKPRTPSSPPRCLHYLVSANLPCATHPVGFVALHVVSIKVIASLTCGICASLISFPVVDLKLIPEYCIRRGNFDSLAQQ